MVPFEGFRLRAAALLVAACSVFAAGALAAPPPAPEPRTAQVSSHQEPWRVLLLLAADYYLPASILQDGALRAELTRLAAPRHVVYQAEALDALSFDLHRYEAELFALIQKKQSGLRYDVVIAMATPALDFALRHREQLWPGTPIVFYSMAEALASPARRPPGTTGATIAFDIEGTIALARRLQPDARGLVLVAGASDYDRSWWPPMRDGARVAGTGLTVQELFGLPLPRVLAAVSRLPRDTIVFYTAMSRDGDGDHYLPADVAAQIGRASTAPVYTLFETQLGPGPLGGSVRGFEDHGRDAARVAIRVLRGERPDDVPVALAGTARPWVDWRQLRRFGISEARLPEGTKVLFKPLTFWEQYRSYVVAAAAVLAIQTGLIVALLVQSRRRQRAESEAQRQRAELAHAARLSAVGQLTASIAHEINQPLGAILSNAEAAELFLDSEPPRLDRVRQILQDIRHEDLRAGDVIREVRALARKAPPDARSLSLNDVVREILPLIEADARRRGAQVETELAERLPAVRGDRVQLQQVVLNLALNGLEAMSGTAGERRLRILTAPKGDQTVELVVSDTGPGIAGEHLPQLFESFFTTKPDGLGLGLSIVRSILEAHGGSIRVENNSGHGATFRIALPSDREGQPPGSRV